MVAIFSQSIEKLVHHLIENLYCKGSGPFEKRLVIVPHPSMKSYLQQKIAEHPSLGIAAGIKFSTLYDAIPKIFNYQGKHFPNFLELSLNIQNEIKTLLDERNSLFTPLYQYLDCPSSSLRTAQLSDMLAQTFLEYGEYGGSFLPDWLKEQGWQQEIWKRIFSKDSPWTYPYQKLASPLSISYTPHLFGFHFLPPLYLHFFKKIGSQFYLFSPCSYFWSDELSAKEKVRTDSLLLMENPLLSNFGKMGRKFFTTVLDQDLETEEDYDQISQKSVLEKMKNAILNGHPFDPSEDRSIQLVSASSKLREVEILYETLISIFGKEEIAPQDVLVLAPDICEYAPYIQAVFDSSDIALDYSIAGLEVRHVSSTVRAFEHFLSLPEKKFSKEAVLKLFSFPCFREKFQLTAAEVETIGGWMERVHVRWGMDKSQREELLMDQIEDGETGTWEWGIASLLSGIIQTADPCKRNVIDFSEIELFDKAIQLLFSLKEDLHPLFANVTQPISSWIAYFQHLLNRYFICDHESLISELASLAASLSHLQSHSVDYISIQRILPSLCGKKSGGVQESHLHGIKFRSLNSGAATSSKIVYLIGMQEGAYPRKNRKKLRAEEFLSKGDFLPSQTDQDRYLFLQLIFSAQNYLILSYQRISEEDQKPLRPSLVIEELSSYLKLNPHHHPAVGYHFSYFEQANSCSKKHFLAAKAFYGETKTPLLPLIPEFYAPSPILSDCEDNLTIGIDQLEKFARHPLRYYFLTVLKMDLPFFERSEEEDEFLLSPLLKKILRDKASKSGLTTILQESEAKGELPRGLFKKIAIQNMQTTFEAVEEHLEHFEISKESIFSQDVDFIIALGGTKSAKISGKLKGCTPKGFIFYGEDSLSDLVKVWPLFLIYAFHFQENPKRILFSKTGEMKQFEFEDPVAHLQNYLNYFAISQKYPSPLLPAFAKPLLKGSSQDLEKEMGKIGSQPFGIEDEILQWMIARDGAISASAIYQNWAPILRSTYGLL